MKDVHIQAHIDICHPIWKSHRELFSREDEMQTNLEKWTRAELIFASLKYGVLLAFICAGFVAGCWLLGGR